MLGDVLLITEKHKKAAKAIVDRLTKLGGDKIIIAVGGESGSGKSEIGHEIASLLKARNTPAKIMHIDNYYKIPPRDRTSWRKEHGTEQIGYHEYDWENINRNIQEFRNDADLAVMPCVDLLTDQEDSLTTSFQGLKYMIIEGLYALKAEVDLRVMVDLTYIETKKAQLVRGKEKMDEWRLQVLKQEHKVVQSLRPLADLFITSDFDVIENDKE